MLGGGSSPRGRGKLDAVPQEARPGRLIPARAGKTVQGSLHCVQGRAHPRAGGENRRRRGEGLEVVGSSPRGRGKRRPRL